MAHQLPLLAGLDDGGLHVALVSDASNLIEVPFTRNEGEIVGCRACPVSSTGGLLPIGVCILSDDASRLPDNASDLSDLSFKAVDDSVTLDFKKHGLVVCDGNAKVWRERRGCSRRNCGSRTTRIGSAMPPTIPSSFQEIKRRRLGNVPTTNYNGGGTFIDTFIDTHYLQ